LTPTWDESSPTAIYTVKLCQCDVRTTKKINQQDQEYSVSPVPLGRVKAIFSRYFPQPSGVQNKNLCFLYTPMIIPKR